MQISDVLHKKFFEAEAEKTLKSGRFCGRLPAPKGMKNKNLRFSREFDIIDDVKRLCSSRES